MLKTNGEQGYNAFAHYLISLIEKTGFLSSKPSFYIY